MSDDGGAFIFGLLIGMVLAGGMSIHGTRSAWQDDMIARDLAIYCPESGSFAFKGECEK